MSLIVSETTTRELIAAGTHVATCVSLIDYGTSLDSYQGGPMRPKRKVWIEWEASEEIREDGEGKKFCLTVSKTLTANLGKDASLRKILDSWRGKPFTPEELKGFDLKNIINKPCLISIIHEPKADGSGMRAVISSVSSLMKGMAKPTQINPTRVLDMDNFDVNVFNDLPDFLKKEIEKSDEYKALKNPGNDDAVRSTFPAADTDEDGSPLPF